MSIRKNTILKKKNKNKRKLLNNRVDMKIIINRSLIETDFIYEITEVKISSNEYGIMDF